MASFKTLKTIVENGSNLVLARSPGHEALHELAAIAHKTGAKLTISSDIAVGVIEALSAAYGNTITFVDGIAGFDTR